MAAGVAAARIDGGPALESAAKLDYIDTWVLLAILGFCIFERPRIWARERRVLNQRSSP